MPAIGPMGENLVFLLGLPRSGTTLLSILLDNHPAIVSPPEPWIMLALEQLGQVEVRHPANAQVLGTAVRRFAGTEGLILAAREAGRALYGTHLIGSSKNIFVDKTPRYLLIPDYLHTVFPQARFLWLVRDPLDVAASYRTTWGMNLPEILVENRDVPELFDLTIGLERLEAFRDRLGDQIHIVSYEHLARDPCTALGAVLKHLGQEVNDIELRRICVLDPAKQRPGQFGDSKIINTTAPQADSIGTWRRVFTPGELQVLLDAVGADRLNRLGYGASVAALAEIGVRESNPSAHTGYHARALSRLAARLDDIAHATTHTDGDDTLWRTQARLHAALSGDTAWNRLIAPLTDAAREASVIAERGARQALETENRRLQAQLTARDDHIAALLASSSWRLTAPLRRLASWFGRSPRPADGG